MEKKVREVDITPATSTSQEDEEPLQANFIDENLEIKMEEVNEPMEIIHEPMKIIPGDHTYCLPNNCTPCYACQDKFNLVKALVSKRSKLSAIFYQIFIFPSNDSPSKTIKNVFDVIEKALFVLKRFKFS